MYGKTKNIKAVGKNLDRCDRYGNFLLSDEALKIGVEAGKKYVDLMLQYDAFDKLMMSPVFRNGIVETATDAIGLWGLNPNYDITIQDEEEIFGLITGLKADYNRDFMPTGHKYSGYNPF